MGEVIELRRYFNAKKRDQFCTDDFLNALQLKIEDLKKKKLPFEGKETLTYLFVEMTLFMHYMTESLEELRGGCPPVV
jgi:hypothetical protein